jgi:UDP-2,4-diacetamido-2,4,6-trideoxy-beta-L-altropyranose hydrolase
MRLGAGHVMRCLVIAREIMAQGGVVEFVSRDLPGNLIGKLRAEGFPVTVLEKLSDGADLASGERLGVTCPQDVAETRAVLQRVRPDCLLVDHYGLSANWESSLRPLAGSIMAIDDLADRPHDCDIILDQNLYDDMEHRYERWVPPSAVRLLGPRHALLRQEFLDARGEMRARSGEVSRILVAFGGSDSSNETAKVLEALDAEAFGEIHIDVVIGGMYTHRDMLISKYGADRRVHFHENISNLSTLMCLADLSIGAGGTMNWERSYLGLPTIVIVIAENQAETSAALDRSGCVINLGWRAQITSTMIRSRVDELSKAPARMRQMSANCLQLMAVPGSPTAQRNIVNLLTRRKSS